jgi:hypothetical protein
MILEGYIVDYDPRTKLASVLTSDGMRRIDDVQVSTLSASGRGGGVRAEPNLGDRCILGGSKQDPKVLGFMGVFDPATKSYGHNEPESTYGDLSFGTAADNFIHIRRSGIIEVKASGLCQTMYIPTGAIIQEHFKQYRGYCPGGEISLATRSARTEEGGGAGAVLFQVNCRGSALDTDMGVRFRLGAVRDATEVPDARLLEHHTPGPVYAEVAVGLGESAYLFQVTPLGEAVERIDQSHIKQVKGTEASLVGAVFKQVEGNVSMEVAGQIDLTCSTDLLAQITNSVRVMSPEIVLEGNVRLGGPDAIENAIKGAAFLTAYYTHSHNGAVPPPIPPADIAQFLSTKVFVK